MSAYETVFSCKGCALAAEVTWCFRKHLRSVIIENCLRVVKYDRCTRCMTKMLNLICVYKYSEECKIYGASNATILYFKSTDFRFVRVKYFFL